MQKVTTRTFQEGQRLKHALFTPAGQKLLSAGIVITAEHLRVLHNLPDPQLYLADSLDELVHAGIITREAQTAIAAGRTPAPSPTPGPGASAGGSAPDGTLSESSGDQAAAAEATRLAESAPPETKPAAPAGPDPADAARLRREMIAQADVVVQQLEAELANVDLRVQPASGTIWDKRGGESEDDGEAESAAGKTEPWPNAATLVDRRGELVAQI